MTDAEFIDALRAKIAEIGPQQRRALAAWRSVIPTWASYFQGYRDALNETIEMIQNPGKIPDSTSRSGAEQDIDHVG